VKVLQKDFMGADKAGKAFAKDLGKITPSGGTDIQGALWQAFAWADGGKPSPFVLRKEIFYKGADTIILVTDGPPTGGDVRDWTAIRTMIRAVNRLRHVAVHVVALGDAPFDELQLLAQDNGGDAVDFTDAPVITPGGDAPAAPPEETEKPQ
jgi:hypothetical protein